MIPARQRISWYQPEKSPFLGSGPDSSSTANDPPLGHQMYDLGRDKCLDKRRNGHEGHNHEEEGAPVGRRRRGRVPPAPPLGEEGAPDDEPEGGGEDEGGDLEDPVGKHRRRDVEETPLLPDDLHDPPDDDPVARDDGEGEDPEGRPADEEEDAGLQVVREDENGEGDGLPGIHLPHHLVPDDLDELLPGRGALPDEGDPGDRREEEGREGHHRRGAEGEVRVRHEAPSAPCPAPRERARPRSSRGGRGSRTPGFPPSGTVRGRKWPG